MVTHTQSSISKFERQNELKNEHYQNMNVDLSRSEMNVHFKSCDNMTYNEYLDKLLTEKKVSMRGLKADAKVYDEIIFDVNTDYFETHGGYEYAKEFYAEAYQFATNLYGEENIISAVMHADELNIALTEQRGKPVYHYHMHLVALPVIEKKILWTKRCKDKALVGTVKEIINQISHSKKWKSSQALDEHGNSIVDKNGKPILIPSYSILQDNFYEHMTKAGFDGFIRGEKGSTTQNLTSLQYQIQKDKERLSENGKNIEIKYAANSEISKTYDDIDNMGKKGISGKYTVSKDDYQTITALAKEGITSRDKIADLNEDIKYYRRRYNDIRSAYSKLYEKYEKLKEKCQPFLYALEHLPNIVQKLVEAVREHIKAEQEHIRKRKLKSHDRDAR